MLTRVLLLTLISFGMRVVLGHKPLWFQISVLIYVLLEFSALLSKTSSFQTWWKTFTIDFGMPKELRDKADYQDSDYLKEKDK